jgi:hypothetical protein
MVVAVSYGRNANEGNYNTTMQDRRTNGTGRLIAFLAGVLTLVLAPVEPARSGDVTGWADVHVHIDGLPNPFMILSRP